MTLECFETMSRVGSRQFRDQESAVFAILGSLTVGRDGWNLPRNIHGELYR